MSFHDRNGKRMGVGDRIYVPPRPHLHPITNSEGEVLLKPGDRGRVYRIEEHARGIIVHFHRTSNGGAACALAHDCVRQYGLTATEKMNKGAMDRARRKKTNR